MKLRHILLILSLFSILATAVGGYFYYTNLQLIALNKVNLQANSNINTVSNHFSAFLAEQLKPARVMAGLTPLSDLLKQTDSASLEQVDLLLDHFKLTLGADVCYLMDSTGLTVASSNRNDPDSFVGKNFSFRPYFKTAIRGSPGRYMALGTASGKRGIYYSYPVSDLRNQQALGVAVIKISVEFVEEELQRFENDHLFLIDPHGIIFLSSNKDWLFHSLWPLTDRDHEEILASRQFGSGPWTWLQDTAIVSKESLTSRNHDYLLYQQPVEEFPGWSIVYTRTTPDQIREFLAPALKSTGALILPIFLLVGLFIFFLYRKAATEITQRKQMELALRTSESRFKKLYMDTPAMLHSIDSRGKMLSISNYWSEALGYSREEVLGKPVTDFMTPSSREYALSTVTPSFLRSGFCKDIPYEFVRKDGTVIDVLLSAIAERDGNGKIVRSLAVLTDITKLKRIENQLKH